jgi:hypothetical protein
MHAASRFYGGLFGWTLTDAVPPGAPGSYLIATLDGQDVAAIGGGSAGVAAAIGAPPHGSPHPSAGERAVSGWSGHLTQCRHLYRAVHA